LDLINYGIFQFWLAGRMILDGINPYDSQQWIDLHLSAGATWIPNNIFPYPLAMTYLLAPIAFLPVKTAYVLWSFLEQLSIALSIFLLVNKWEKNSHKIFASFLLIGAVLFYPTSLGIANSAVSGFLILFLVLGINSHEKNSAFVGGALIGVLLFKPTLGLTFCGVIGLWALLRRDWSIIGGMGFTAVLIFIVSLWGDPHWVSKFLAAGGEHLQNTFQRQPTVWNLSNVLCESNRVCALGSTALIFLFSIAITFYFVLRNNAKLDIVKVSCFAIVLTMILAPYIWPYEYILLIIPIVIICEKLIVLTKTYIGSAAFLAINVGISFYSLLNDPKDSFQGVIVVPLFIYFALITLQFFENKKSNLVTEK
jgi:hypothetical protein